MDTTILGILTQLAPDLMEEMELRALILERVAALGPIGRRALAARLNLAEREVRTAADALKEAGCLSQSAAGMTLTPEGERLTDAARTVSRGRRTLQSMEQALARKLGVARVCIVRGNRDDDPSVLEETARSAARELRHLIQGAHVLAVSGGETIALMSEAVAQAAPMELTVVPAQGGTGTDVRLQANTQAELLARRLGGSYRLLHLPDGLTADATDGLARLPQVREVLELMRSADVLLYGVGPAQAVAARRGMSLVEREALAREGAVAEALGFFFDARGRVVGAGCSLALSEEALGRDNRAAIVAAGASKAAAIAAVCAHHPHRLLVTDEGAAARLLELLRD